MRYVCIHGHFYQPPRENPWLEAIEWQDSAYPYHDWNERVTAECYAPNTAARILGEDGKIFRILNNYAWMSFNFGPTLLSWMEANAQDPYEAVLKADKVSRARFSGHGSAMAQPYNHMILPLANERDKRTQVLWGIEDFKARFGREPEGMWLPETAVDVKTLEVLAEFGLRFTVLAPYQASRVRPIGGGDWRDVRGGKIDTSIPYLVRLPSGKTIAAFFYNGNIAQAVAFGGLLDNGKRVAESLVAGVPKDGEMPRLSHIATDGESYGHHHRFGDMALAYALHHIQVNGLAQITNYGEFLEKCPPISEAEIIENTSWSCIHGIERWRSDCGCQSGRHPGWNQAWREPLREAFDWLRDTLAPKFEEGLKELFYDPWRARDDYIGVLLDRTEDAIEAFLAKHGRAPLDQNSKVRALKLLELQRHAMLMYTSCGWFFDDLSGIETVQVIQYAGRALQLASQLFGDHLEARFMERLSNAKSNVKEMGDGKAVFGRIVKPAMLDLVSAGAHYAISSIFEQYPSEARIYKYTAKRLDFEDYEAGRVRLILGRARMTSSVTLESLVVRFVAVHFGDHALNAGVCPENGDMPCLEEIKRPLLEAFRALDVAGLVRLMDQHFGCSSYTLKSLFRDAQRRELGRILESTLGDIEQEYRQVFDRYEMLMRFLSDLGVPLPQAFKATVRFILNTDLVRLMERYPLDTIRIVELLHDAKAWGVELDTPKLSFVLTHTLEDAMGSFFRAPMRIGGLKELVESLRFLKEEPFDVNLWKVQNLYYEAYKALYKDAEKKAQEPLLPGTKSVEQWVRLFSELGELLGIRLVE